MLGEVYNKHDGKRLVFDSVEIKKKYVYFNNSLLGTTFIVGGITMEEAIKREMLLLVKEGFYTGAYIPEFKMRTLGGHNLIVKELELKQPKLANRTLADLNVSDGTRLYVESEKGIHKVLNISKTFYSVILEMETWCIVIESEDNEIINAIYSIITKLYAEEKRVILSAEYLEECLYNTFEKTVKVTFQLKKLKTT